MNEAQRKIIDILIKSVSGVSVFVAIVLGLLIVYMNFTVAFYVITVQNVENFTMFMP